MSNLPERIQIGPIAYTVTTDPADYNAVVAEHMTHFFGYINPQQGRITLNDEQSSDHSRWALLHEVMHGCWHTVNPEGDTFTEEQAIRLLAGPLLDTLRRNPALVSFLMTEDRDG